VVDFLRQITLDVIDFKFLFFFFPFGKSQITKSIDHKLNNMNLVLIRLNLIVKLLISQ